MRTPTRPSTRAVRLGAVLLASVVALTACTAAEPTEPETVTVTPTVEPTKQAPPAPVVPVVWPLTGTATAEVAARPAVAVKIENSSTARPQSGLEQADVVWETIIDFDVSRLIAVFHSQVPAEVGPIRSVRPMDMDVVRPLAGPLVFSGGQAGILALVDRAGIQAMNNDYAAPGMYRVSFRSAPHNVYGSVQTFVDNAATAQPPAPQFAFARRAEQASATTAGSPATLLSLDLSSQSDPQWTWDAASGTWLRSEGTTPATVASGARIGAVNVVGIVADHPNSGFGAQNGAPVPTYVLVGQGEGWVATAGKVLPVTWRKTAPEAPLELLTADGAVATLAPGNTWVELIPAGTGSATLG